MSPPLYTGDETLDDLFLIAKTSCSGRKKLLPLCVKLDDVCADVVLSRWARQPQAQPLNAFSVVWNASANSGGSLEFP